MKHVLLLHCVSNVCFLPILLLLLLPSLLLLLLGMKCMCRTWEQGVTLNVECKIVTDVHIISWRDHCLRCKTMNPNGYVCDQQQLDSVTWLIINNAKSAESSWFEKKKKINATNNNEKTKKKITTKLQKSSEELNRTCENTLSFLCAKRKLRLRFSGDKKNKPNEPRIYFCFNIAWSKPSRQCLRWSSIIFFYIKINGLKVRHKTVEVSEE